MNTVIAVSALVVAVFGSTPLGHAAASMVLPASSVGTAQLKVAAVTGAKVKNGTLTAAKFKAGQLPAGPQGPKGDTGAAGAAGPAGPKGPSGVSGFEALAQGSTLNPGQAQSYDIQCPSGKRAISGGYWVQSGQVSIPIDVQSTQTSWTVGFVNTGGSPATVHAYAYCALSS